MRALFDYLFRSHRPESASLAKERLSIIVAREGRSKGAPDYLPQLKRELLEVLAKYEKIDLEQVSVNVEAQGDREVLELNVILGEEAAAAAGAAGRSPLDTRPAAAGGAPHFELPSIRTRPHAGAQAPVGPRARAELALGRAPSRPPAATLPVGAAREATPFFDKLTRPRPRPQAPPHP